MGHLGAQNLNKLPHMLRGVDFTQTHKEGLCVYETCLSTKGKRRLHNHQIEPGRHKLELIYSDVVGPIPVLGFDGSRYLVTFQCDKTKFAQVYLIKSKGEVTDCFIYFKKHYERLDKGEVIRRLRDDNGGEYIAGKL